MDKVIRLEDIQSELPPHLRSLGIPLARDAQLGHRNHRGGKPPYQSYYTPELAQWIAEHYRYDIENYGYRFEGD